MGLKHQPKIPKDQVDWKKVNMKKKDEFWTDAMAKSTFNFQPSLPSSGVGGSSVKITHLASSRRRSTSHAVGTRNFI